MQFKNVEEALASYDIKVKKTNILTERATQIATDKDELFVLKQKESPKAFQREHELLKHLNTKGLSVQHPVSNQNEQFLVSHQNKYYVMYSYIEGETFSAVECIQDPVAPTALGSTLAKMHQSLHSYETSEAWKHTDLYQMVYEYAVSGIVTGVCSWRLGPIYAHLEERIKRFSDTLPKQLIHRDAHIHNILFHENDLAGVIDFDLAEVNHTLFDLCYCATSVLSEVYDKGELRDAWPTFVQRLVEAYDNG
ncbi:phosphotransferase [Alkalihalobacillus sp. FSL W8-0930]